MVSMAWHAIQNRSTFARSYGRPPRDTSESQQVEAEKNQNLGCSFLATIEYSLRHPSVVPQVTETKSRHCFQIAGFGCFPQSAASATLVSWSDRLWYHEHSPSWCGVINQLRTWGAHIAHLFTYAYIIADLLHQTYQDCSSSFPVNWQDKWRNLTHGCVSDLFTPGEHQNTVAGKWGFIPPKTWYNNV